MTSALSAATITSINARTRLLIGGQIVAVVHAIVIKSQGGLGSIERVVELGELSVAV